MSHVIEMESPVRMLLVGHNRAEFREAARMAAAAGAEVRLTGTVEEALAQARRAGADLAMVDVGADIGGFIRQLRAERMALPVLGCGVNISADQAVAAIRAGAQDYVPLPPNTDLIAAAILSVAVRSLRLIGQAPAFRKAATFALAMARSSTPILIGGEPGTGRETLARAIHQASGRPGRFVALNIAEAALSDEMIESELFGQEAGAFEGAVARRRGRIEEANGGTLYLGEVGLLSQPMQARLLRLVAERRISRLGGREDIWADARIISGTALDLKARVEDGTLNSDLFARLGSVFVKLPPLRARGSDIAAIAAHFASRFADAHGLPNRTLSTGALKVLMSQHWQGNIRELEYAMLRAVMIAEGPEIGPEALTLADGSPMPLEAPRLTQSEWGRTVGHAAAGHDNPSLVGRTVAEVERELILSTLEQCRGNRTSASAILGISVRTMRNKLKSFVESGVPVAAAQ